MTTKQNTAHQDLSPQEFIIGKWTCPPFSLNTAILLEQIGSPFMTAGQTDPATGQPVSAAPGLTDVAMALYVILNGHKPGIHEILCNEVKFKNEVSNLASQITMREFAQITGQLNAMMASLNDVVVESGVPTDGEKKEGIGPSE
jgi:hypothetical protein